MSDAARFWVSSRVQGVGFRASTRAQALKLGLRGYARNLPDGRVEVLALGPEGAIAALEAWLQRGPLLARVESLQRESAAVGEIAEGFTTG